MSNNRLYSGTDAYMAESARTIHQLLTTDVAQFSAFSSRFNAAYLTDFLAKIDAADAVITDESIISQQITKTEAVLTAMDRARLLYRRAKAYAELTFADTRPVLIQEFTRGYAEARQNQPKMIVFLEMLWNTVNTHSDALKDPTKGGMPNNFADEIEALREELQSKNVTQETFINTRTTLAESRINTLNACYTKMTEVNNFAQVVFEDSPAKRSIYTYRSFSNPADSNIFTGSVATGEYQTITTLPYEAARFISFENKGVVPLVFDIAPESTANDATALAGNVVDLGGGAVVNQTMAWLNGDIAEGTAVKIIAYNASATETGAYEVSINVE